MYDRLRNKEIKLAVIGLGYVGLPLAMEFAGRISVIGFDIDEERLARLRAGIDPCGELPPEAFEGKDINYSMKKVIEYEGEELPVTMYWDIEEFLSPGDYRVDIFADGNLIGRKKFTLED